MTSQFFFFFVWYDATIDTGDLSMCLIIYLLLLLCLVDICEYIYRERGDRDGGREEKGERGEREG